MAKATLEKNGKATATLRVDVNFNGLDAAEAYIGALAVVEHHRARIAELEAELAATRRQPMGTAPKTPDRILVWLRQEEDWSNFLPPVVAVRAGPVWMMLTPTIEGGLPNGVSSTLLRSDLLVGWAPLPTSDGWTYIPNTPSTPERQAESDPSTPDTWPSPLTPDHQFR